MESYIRKVILYLLSIIVETIVFGVGVAMFATAWQADPINSVLGQLFVGMGLMTGALSVGSVMGTATVGTGNPLQQIASAATGMVGGFVAGGGGAASGAGAAGKATEGAAQ